MSSFSSFAPGSSLAFPSSNAGTGNSSGGGGGANVNNGGGFALPPLPAPAPAAKLIEGDPSGKDVPMLDGSETAPAGRGGSGAGAGAGAAGAAAAGTSAIVGTSGAIPQMIPSHGIVPTVQLVKVAVVDIVREMLISYRLLARKSTPYSSPTQKYRRNRQPERQARPQDDCSAWVLIHLLTYCPPPDFSWLTTRAGPLCRCAQCRVQPKGWSGRPNACPSTAFLRPAIFCSLPLLAPAPVSLQRTDKIHSFPLPFISAALRSRHHASATA